MIAVPELGQRPIGRVQHEPSPRRTSTPRGVRVRLLANTD